MEQLQCECELIWFLFHLFHYYHSILRIGEYRGIMWKLTMTLKLSLRNLDQMCKWPLLRSLLFCGVIDLDFQIFHHRLKVGLANSDPKSIYWSLLRSLLICGLNNPELHFHFYFKPICLRCGGVRLTVKQSMTCFDSCSSTASQSPTTVHLGIVECDLHWSSV